MIESWVNYVKKFHALKMSNELGEKTKVLGGNDKDFYNNIDVAIADAKLFTIEEETVKLLTLTNCPDKNSKLKMPFKSMFVNTEITKYQLEELGIKVEGDLHGFIIQEGQLKTNMSSDVVAGKTIRVIACIQDNQYIEFNTYNIMYDVADEFKGFKITEETKTPKMKKFLSNYVRNLVNLINEPDIQIVTQHEDVERNKKRESKGKIMIPTNLIVRITGERRAYINGLVEGGKFSYGYRFFVKGHWRELRSERYGVNQGNKTWILPYIKGSEGALINKTYHVEKKNV